MKTIKPDHLILAGAFALTLIAYVVLVLSGDDANTLRDILLALVGALAGVSIPRGTAAP